MKKITILLLCFALPKLFCTPAHYPTPDFILTTNDSSIHSIAFNPSGTMLAVGYLLGKIILWDIGNHEQISALYTTRPIEIAPVSFLAWSLDGKQLISCDSRAKVLLWDIQEPRNISLTPRLLTDQSRGPLALSPDTKTLAFKRLSSNTQLWDIERNTTSKELLNSDNILSLAFNPNGLWLAGGLKNGDVGLWSTKIGDNRTLSTRGESALPKSLLDSLLHSLFGDHDFNLPIEGIAFNQDGRILVAVKNNSYDVQYGNYVRRDNAIHIWDINETNKEPPLTPRTPIPTGGQLASKYPLAFEPGRTISRLAVGYKNNTVRLWNLETREVVAIFDTVSQPMTLAFNPHGGGMLAVGCEDGSVRIWNYLKY